MQVEKMIQIENIYKSFGTQPPSLKACPMTFRPTTLILMTLTFMDHLHRRSLQSKTGDDSDTQQSLLYIYGLNENES